MAGQRYRERQTIAIFIFVVTEAQIRAFRFSYLFRFEIMFQDWNICITGQICLEW